MKKNYPLSRKNNVVIQELNGEVLIYDLNDNKAFCLNETSALVWQMCDGSKSVVEISESVGKKLNASANEDLIWLAIDQLKKEKLIENETELVSPFMGMNRREVIKKVGLATMIALPIVASMVAPTAAHAISVCGTNCMCTNTVAAMAICIGGPGGGNNCSGAPAGCQTCRSNAGGTAGTCFTG